jgi:alkaline phosphatase D
MDPDLAAAHASAPFIVTWDDHEVDNNYAGELDERGTPPALFLLRRAAAYQAYYEAMPLRASTIPFGPNMQIYRRLQFGRLIDFSVLDTRQWRGDRARNDGNRTDCVEALDGRSSAASRAVALQEPCEHAGHLDHSRPAGTHVCATW